MLLLTNLRLVLRTLRKRPLFTAINLTGLCLGITASLMMLFYVQQEYSTDNFHSKKDRIYRMLREVEKDKGNTRTPYTPGALGPALKNDFPDAVEAMAQVIYDRQVFLKGNEPIREKMAIYASEDFLHIFDFPLVAGDLATCLREPNSLVLTESTAKRYFGESPALGQSLRMGDSSLFQVTGVLEDIPDNSHLQFDVVVSFSTVTVLDLPWVNEWSNNYLDTYVLLAPGVEIEQVRAQLPGFWEKYMGDFLKSNGFAISLLIQPLHEIYFDDSVTFDFVHKGNARVLSIFLTAALFLLFIAMLNYINLSTSQYSGRMKESGIKKVLGASRSGLSIQFMLEAFVQVFIATAFSLALMELLMPAFSTLTDKQLSIPYESWWFLPALAGFICLTGVLSGLYPAVFFSASRPIAMLKKEVKVGSKHLNLRRLLVMAQFLIAIVLISGSLIIHRQLHFLHNQDLGFDREQVLTIPLDNGTIRSDRDIFKQRLLENKDILFVETMSGTPGGFHDSYNRELGTTGEQFSIRTVFAGHDYISTLGAGIIAGRDLDKNNQTDATGAVLLNEAAVKRLGWTPEEAIGQKIIEPAWANWSERMEKRVVGVVADFHFESMHKKIEPLIVSISDDRRMMAIRVSGHHLPGTIAFIKEVYSDIAPRYPPEVNFLDASLGELYKKEQVQSQLASIFTGLALLIAGLGLFGLVSFSTEQRSKEIGIRKVLGAEIYQLILLLGREYLYLIAISFVLAVPLSYLLLQNWLDDFAYKIAIGIPDFLLAALAIMAVIAITVGRLSWKAARNNPADCLHDE